jgi:hypothetical protein
MQEISDTAPQWWEIQNIPTECIRELRRRSNSTNIGMNIPQPYVPNSNFNFDANYDKYKGPMTPWVRLFSNSTGKSINGLVPRSVYLDKNKQQTDYDGFILKGGDGFYDAFGYEQNKPLNSRYAIIGYEANGTPHYIDNINRSQLAYNTGIDGRFPQNNQSPSIVPPPGIISLNVKQSKDLLTYADFEFKCFGLAQLEYLTPFFLTAGMNLIVEFGWNLFNQKSIVDLTNLDECWRVTNEPQTALDRSALSNGNYGCVTGIITKYSFKTQDGFVYNCNVEMISRQALYAGLKTDNNAKAVIKSRSTTQTKDEEFDREFIDLKTFIKLYLPDINAVIQQQPKKKSAGNPYSTEVTNLKANFLNYILDKINQTDNNKKEKDEKAQSEASQKGRIQNLPNLQTFNGNYDLFYNGKAEDRVFCGRNFKKAYQAEKNPSKDSLAISYGTVDYGIVKYEQLSFVDNNLDFDAKDSTDDVWLQLDFVFEVFNLFMSNLGTKQFYIDIQDVIVNAHPNLISCDRDVLIPNPVAPKINIGVQKSKNPGVGGFLKKEQSLGTILDADSESQIGGNAFIDQIPDITVNRNIEIEKKIKESSDAYYNLNENDSYYLACEAARKTFKTKGRCRDDLDKVINYLYYHVNEKEKGSASFPFKQELKKVRQTKNGSTSTVTYKPYYYGYLKHIYISKSKIIDLCKSETKGTDGYKNLISSILNVINQSVDNFWKFEIVQGASINGKSTISIVDKNTINLSMLQQIYAFELGSTNNVIKNINFDVSLTNEQATNVLFSNQNSSLISSDPLSKIQDAKTIGELNVTLNNLNNMMPLKFEDRLDKYQLEKLSIQKSGSLATLTPGACAGIESENNDIVNLQVYGSKEMRGVLCMTFKNVVDFEGAVYIDRVTTVQAQREAAQRAALAGARAGGTGAGYGTDIANIDPFAGKDTRNNYKYLCLPPSMKSRLRQMLDDGDFKNNQAKYSGVADNFQVSITFDGIFSFRNLQCFAIKNLPKPYVPGNIIFQVLEVEHKIESGKWETVVNALVRAIGTSRIEYISI